MANPKWQRHRGQTERGITDQHTLTRLGNSGGIASVVAELFPIFVGLGRAGFMEAQRALFSVMRGWVVLGSVVSKVASARFPFDDELSLLDAVLEPVETHVDGFRAALFDSLVEDAPRDTVVGGHRSGRLWPAHLPEGGPERAQLLGVVESPSNFSIGSRGVDILHDSGKDIEGTIKRGR